jgi:hypothetical protein
MCTFQLREEGTKLLASLYLGLLLLAAVAVLFLNPGEEEVLT